MIENKTESTEPKTCSACGGEFGCGARSEGCWCSGVQLAPKVANELKEQFDDCLCPDCLANVAHKLPDSSVN